MKILIDCTQIPLEKTGMGIYAINLISEIHSSDETNMYYILIQDDDDEFRFITKSNFILKQIKSGIFRRLFLRFLLEQLYIPYFILKNSIEIIHSLHYSFPLLPLPAKKIVTIPDLTFFKYPQYHVKIKVGYFRLFIRLAAFLADTIITISQSSKTDFLNMFNVNKDKIAVTYLGTTCHRDLLDDEESSCVKEKFSIKNEYILYLGTIEPRKNIKNLIAAFEKITQSGYDGYLVIAGKKGWDVEDVFGFAERVGLKNKIIFTGYVYDNEKAHLIKGAKIFVYPSIYEGFGIPVLEALALGVPTITSNVSSLPEVAGDAALLVDPSNINELFLSMRKLLNNRMLYKNFQERSLAQAKKFSWEITAKETIKVYNSWNTKKMNN